MRHFIIFGLISTIVTGCGTGTPKEKQPKILSAKAATASAPTIEVVDTFHKALANGDAKQALALLSDDVLIYEGGGAETSKAEYTSHHLAADMAFLKGVTQSVSSRSAQASGDTALVTSQGATTGTYKGKAIDSRSTETIALRLIEGQWKIVHIHWSSADNKPKLPSS